MVATSRVTLPTPLGDLTIVCTPSGVAATTFDDPDAELAGLERALDAVEGPGETAAARSIAVAARGQASSYFRGVLDAVTVPPDLSVAPRGFGRRVLGVVATIPPSELWTYGDVAGMAGSPRAARAAGSALASCPIELFVPCHRVVHAGGTLGGYGRHEERKRWLIAHERAD